MWDVFPRPEMEPVTLHWDCTVLTTEPPGNSHTHLTFDAELVQSLVFSTVGFEGFAIKNKHQIK